MKQSCSGGEGGAAHSHPTLGPAILPSTPEIPLWKPRCPGTQVKMTDFILCSTGPERLKLGTYSQSWPRVVGRISTRAHVSLFLVHSHFQSLLRTLISYALQNRHFLRRTQSLVPLCPCTCCSLCLTFPSSLAAYGGHTLRQPPEIPKS